MWLEVFKGQGNQNSSSGVRPTLSYAILIVLGRKILSVVCVWKQSRWIRYPMIFMMIWTVNILKFNEIVDRIYLQCGTIETQENNNTLGIHQHEFCYGHVYKSSYIWKLIHTSHDIRTCTWWHMYAAYHIRTYLPADFHQTDLWRARPILSFSKDNNLNSFNCAMLSITHLGKVF